MINYVWQFVLRRLSLVNNTMNTNSALFYDGVHYIISIIMSQHFLLTIRCFLSFSRMKSQSTIYYSILHHKNRIELQTRNVLINPELGTTVIRYIYNASYLLIKWHLLIIHHQICIYDKREIWFWGIKIFSENKNFAKTFLTQHTFWSS